MCIDFLKLMYVVIVVISSSMRLASRRWGGCCCAVLYLQCTVSYFRALALLPLLCGYYLYRFYYNLERTKINKICVHRRGIEDATIDLIRYLTRSHRGLGLYTPSGYIETIFAPLHAIPEWMCSFTFCIGLISCCVRFISCYSRMCIYVVCSSVVLFEEIKNRFKFSFLF